MKKILIVQKYKDSGSDIKDKVGKEGELLKINTKIDLANCFEEAKIKLENNEYDLVITGYSLWDDNDGLEGIGGGARKISKMAKIKNNCKVWLFSGLSALSKSEDNFDKKFNDGQLYDGEFIESLNEILIK